MTVFMAILALTVPVGLTLYFDRPAYGTMALVSIIVGMLILRFDSIKKLSILGLLNADLKETIQKANLTLEQAKSIAIASSKVAMRELTMSHFPTLSPQFSSSYELHEEIIRSLKAIDVSSAELEDVDQGWKNGIGMIVHREICHLLHPGAGWGITTRDGEPTDDEIEASKHIQGLADFKLGLIPSLVEIKSALAGYEISDKALEPINEILEDYESFLMTGVLKNPSRFDKSAQS